MDSHSDSKKCGATYRVQEDMGFSVRHRLCYCYAKAQVKSACPSESSLSGKVPLDSSLTGIPADSRLVAGCLFPSPNKG